MGTDHMNQAPNRAERIITRRDPATEADLVAWSNIGDISI